MKKLNRKQIEVKLLNSKVCTRTTFINIMFKIKNEMTWNEVNKVLMACGLTTRKITKVLFA